MSITLQEMEKTAFLSPAIKLEGFELVDVEEGKSAMIEGKEYPILSEVFNIMVVQSGHGLKDKRFSGHAGEIYIDGIEEFHKERTLLPISIVRYGQQLYEGGFDAKKDEKNKPVCYSMDGLKPSPKLAATAISHECCVLEEGRNGVRRVAVCPKAQWGEDGAKPECRTYVVLAFLDITDPEQPFPLKMLLKSTGYSAFTALQKSFNRVRNVARLKKQSVNDYVLSLKVEDKGTYYVPVFTPVFSDQKPSKYMQMCAYYRDIVNRSDQAQVQKEEAEDVDVMPAEGINTKEAQAAADSAVDFEF